MRVLIKIAWRNIWRNSVRSLIIITSIVLGLWAGTFVSAIYYGMGEDRVRIAIENEISHIQIHNPKYKDDFKVKYAIDYNDTMQAELKNTPNVKAWSARSRTQGMITSTTASSGVQINGIEPAAEDSTTHLGKKIIEGEYLAPGRRNQIIVGAKLARRLKLKLKSKVVITFLDKDDNMSSAAFKVVGIYESSNSTWDDANVFVKREDLNPLLNIDANAAHEIAILLNTNRLIDTTEAQLKKDFPQYKVESWMEIAPEINVVISLMGQVSTIFVIIILLALSFGIINIMLMAVLERTREIGMMIALGMTRFKVFQLVVLETFFLVMLGSPTGMLIAYGTISWLSVKGIDLSSFAQKSMASMGMSSVIYPALPWASYEQIIILVMITAVLSAVFPAIKALRLNPAETIKT
ncbi:MAG TPA: FtsX-like permease family protein [Chitinophagales bacterium]|nr:FtsX-like permease family protein [Chitinophagales bacterium]